MMHKAVNLIVVPGFLIALAAIVTFVIQLPTEAAAAKIESSNPLTGDKDAIKAGKTLYRANCALCHGIRANGKGRGLPNSADLRKFKKGYSKYVYTVLNGGKTMPRFGGMKPLSGDEINQVGAYLETVAIRGAIWLDPKK